MKRIAIVTISYNQRQYLGDACRAISAQLRDCDRHVIVDAGSTDGSRELIDKIAGADQRVVKIFEPDQGPADGLNKGCRFAARFCDVMGYINADDFLLPGSMEYVRHRFDSEPALELLLGAIKLAGSDGHIIRRGRVPDRPTRRRLKADVWQYFQQGTFFSTSCFARSPGFNIANRTCWDREIVVDMVLGGAKWSLTSRPLGAFRMHGGSITSGGMTARYLRDHERIRDKIRSVLGVSGSGFLRPVLQLESRYNPLRWVRQYRQCLI